MIEDVSLWSRLGRTKDRPMSQQCHLPRRGGGWNREGNSRMQAHTMRDWLKVGGFSDDIQANPERPLWYLPLDYDETVQVTFPEGRAAVTCNLQLYVCEHQHPEEGLLPAVSRHFWCHPEKL